MAEIYEFNSQKKLQTVKNGKKWAWYDYDMMWYVVCAANNERIYFVTKQHIRAVATGGISGYILPPPKNQSTVNFLCGCFVSLQWLVNIYTHPNQIPGYASAAYSTINTATVLTETIIFCNRCLKTKTKCLYIKKLWRCYSSLRRSIGADIFHKFKQTFLESWNKEYWYTPS